ncbi:hypothetical protein [Shimazuella kribbensis]|uniref:hypothetical protein n=1 Tax=Shimazuella kribbensis TaxID=139808 RepID=UPI000413C304
MSFPTIPNITPMISLNTNDTITLLLSSIAFEELALAHIMNAEAEKIQFVLGTLDTRTTLHPTMVTIEDLVTINTEVRKTLQDVIKKEMLLQFKLENVLQLITTQPTSECLCTATNQAGNNFDICRGTGAADTTVVFNGMTQPANKHGSVNFSGHICLSCTSDNEFLFTFGGNQNIPAFTFTATTFNVPSCPDQTVTITGEGNTNNSALFGPNPATFTLELNGVPNNKSIALLITGSNGNVFFTSTINLGNAELVVTDCE